MSQPCAQVVAVAPRPALRERGGQPSSTPALVAYSSSVHASRPLRSSPLAGPAFSSNPSIVSLESSQSQCPSAFSLDVGPYSRSQPSSVISHTGSISATTSSHAHRAPGPLAGPSKSAGAIPTLSVDARPYSRSSPSSVISHASSISASSSSFSSHARTTAPVKSTSAIPTFGLFRRQAKDEPVVPLPTQAPFNHSRSSSLPLTTPRPAHIPQTYSPSTSRPSTSPKPSVSRNPNDNWMSSSPFGPASTPRFSRQSMSSKPVVMPLSAREYRRRKCVSTMTNSSATFGSPVTEGIGKEDVNSLPHIIISDSEAPGASPSVPPSGNRSSRRASSPTLPRSRDFQLSPSQGSREPALSEKSSISTFFSLSENEAESAVITVVDPGVTPRRRKSYPNPTQRHSRISLVDAVNRLSQISGTSGDTMFFDMDDGHSPRQRQISVTEDDGVLRRASSRRKKTDVPSREPPPMADAAAEPIAPQERTRVVRILEANEVSSIPVLGSGFSDISHDHEKLVSGDTSTERAASSSNIDSKATGTSSTEVQVRSRKKLTKSRTQSVQAPPARLTTPSLPWIPRPPSPFFRGSSKQNLPKASTSDVTLQENAPQTPEIGDNEKENKRRGRRLTFQFIPSPSFQRRPKSASGIPASLDLKSPVRNDTRKRTSESRFGSDSALSSLTGSATTITLMPPPPITSSSSVSSSAGNSTSSLTDGSSTTMASRGTSATSVVSPSLQTLSRGVEYSYPKVPSNLKKSIVAQSGSDADIDESATQQENLIDASKTFVDPPSASHDQELQDSSSSSFITVSSYASFTSYSTSVSVPAALDARNAPGFLKHRDQALDPNAHPMWTVPMVTVTAASPTTPLPHTTETSPTLHEPSVRPSFLAVPVHVPTSRSTARLKRPRPRPRPQTAPGSPTAPHFPTPPSSKSPRAAGTSSGFKSVLRSLLGRAG
ncbi:hypothetical protein DEU56DRAFT_981459 [Suillus clintonianus]|uniref:uncharacterized protein n=1 Tax=Suillus clintonianus TaxID=1904413 RepID=UPI001B85F9B0|nr:uncharacterized protein DEU56DRAFT_981459 [Suillus clintonianus]KAG2134140.1 hypothetical protein DEU56DRAFT_981459 [Suillus clintonianus]